MKDGQGKYVSNDGMLYTGQWKANRKEGNGVCTWNDGKVYKGEWKNDMFEGQGILTQYLRYGKVEYQG